MKKVFFILSLFGLVACTNLESRQLTFPERIAKQVKTIEKVGIYSASTRIDILRKFGKPEDMLVLDQVGTEVWKYIISDNYQTSPTKSYEFVLTLKETGKVYSYTLIPIEEKANPNKYWLNQKIDDFQNK